jgi:hypothetical protein
MKTTKALFGILTITAALAMNGRSQVYTLSTPITGYMTMSVQDTNGPTGSSGEFYFNFTNLTETIYLDPVGETIRQVGVISGTPSATNISFQEAQQIPGQFPNPPTNASGSVTVTLAPIGGSIPFDTGPQPLTWTPASGAYTCDGNLTNLGNFVGTYSLITGGQTYSGSFTYGLSFASWWPCFTFNTVSTIGYPNSLALSGLGYAQSAFPAMFAPSPSVVADVVANNGFNMVLQVGHSSMGYAGEEFEWNSPGTITATLISNEPPFITTQPQSVVVNAYDTASFSVIASGTPPLSYQWSLNGTNISGATSSSLTISNVSQSDLGAYAVIVTNEFGSATSSNAMLSMYPFIATPFTGAITYWGQSATLSMQAWGTGPLSYQWFDNSVAILNATNQTLSLTNIQFTNAGLYSVVVTSPLGAATNAPAQVVVNAAGVSLGFCPALTISGVVGYSYIIQSAPNLTNTNAWVTLTNLTLTQPVQIWVDTSVDASSPFYPMYFYRVLPGQ